MFTSESTKVTTSFRAMGSAVEITVWGEAELVDSLIALAPLRIELLEQSWSRFREDSELSRNNAWAGNGPRKVSEDFARLVREMRNGAAVTQGLFNPTMAQIIESLGYNQDFDSLSSTDLSPLTVPTVPSVNGIHLDGNQLTLDRGVALDPGALGKGLAGDIVCEEFMSAGAQGVLANIGGDVTVKGSAAAEPWCIGIVDEQNRANLVTTITRNTSELAVATSTTLRRTWGKGKHHILDPRTGNILDTDLLQASVIAETGVKAEVFATAAMVLGSKDAPSFLDAHGVEYLLVSHDHIDQRINNHWESK